MIASLGYMMKFYTQLTPMAIYAILTVAVFTLSPLLYELLRRIPFLRWCVLGIGKVKNGKRLPGSKGDMACDRSGAKVESD